MDACVVEGPGDPGQVQAVRKFGRFRTAQNTFTDEDLRTGIAYAEYNVAFEIDQIDLETREGWTVLVRGSAHHVDTEAERTSVIKAGVEPWIEGEPEHVIRINPARIWGHRIRRA